MSSISLIEYFGNGMYRYIDSDGIEHILREPVKCKDCKYWEKKENAVWCRRTAIGIFRMEEDDFCSRGERK